MENILPAQANAEPQQRASKKATMLSLVSSIVINIVLPIVIYSVLTSYTSSSDLLALAISGAPSLIESLVGLISRKRIDLLSGIILAGIVVSIVIIALGGSPKVYLIRESFFTAAFGLAYLISMIFPRPLAFYFARHFATGNHPENIPWFDSLWERAQFRHTMYVITIVWGIGFLFEAVLRTFLVMVLSVQLFLIVSPFVLYGMIGLLFVWMFLYSREGRKKGEVMRQQMLAK